MKINSNVFLQLLAFAIAIVIIFFPAVLFLMTSTESDHQSLTPRASGWILIRTFVWSLGVGVCSTAIGWFVGLRISTLRHSTFLGVIVLLLMSLATPAYAIYYAWWQSWPAGSWLHEYVVQYGLLETAMKVCAFVALIGWSWPIPALVSAMSSRSSNGLLLLHKVDGAPLLKRISHHLRAEKKMLFASLMIVAAMTATNTTCFDLAQVSTIGNELRAVIASNGSFWSAPWLSFSSVLIAVFASLALLRCKTHQQSATVRTHKTVWLVAVVWFLLTGGPLFLSALTSIGNDSVQLWAQYKGDIGMSAIIAISVGAIACLIVVSSMTLHVSPTKQVNMFANLLDFVWIFVAFLPASLIASIVGHAWNLVQFDNIDRTPLILILAQVSRIGFVGSLAGRWIASCQNTRTLCQLDAPQSIHSLCKATCPNLLRAIFVTFAISIAMSFGEVALTTQLAPPSSHQPISVALLNAMHYQRPQIVTSALFLLVSIAVVGGVFVVVINRKIAVSVVLLFVLSACQVDEKKPIPDATITGSAGYSNSFFMTPRAIDAQGEMIVVIDKTGRLQRFTHEGKFLSSWDLELSGTGYPTGVSIDGEGNIWIADTHQNRVLVLDPTGGKVMTFGEYGTEDGQFLYPTDIAFGMDGEVYVSEYGGNDRISVFDRSGNFIRTIGSHGDGQNEFRRPQSIAIHSDTGNLYVADSGNHRIVVLNRDGKVLRTISEVGRKNAQLLYPYGILIDTPDSFLVSEYGNNRLQRFSLEGQSLGTWGSAGSEIGLLRTPWGVAATSSGIVVADTGNNRLQLLPYIMMTNP